MRASKLGAVALLIALGSACTAAKATFHILAAEQSLSRAEEHGAPDLAVYEYTMAVRYLEKSREESGFADYRISEELAKKSAEWSDKAIISIEQRGRRNVELDLEGLDDLPDLDGTMPPPPPGTFPESGDLLEDDPDETPITPPSTPVPVPVTPPTPVPVPVTPPTPVPVPVPLPQPTGDAPLWDLDDDEEGQ